MKVYLDNNATTCVDDRVLEAMMPYLKEDYANPSSMLRAAELLLKHIGYTNEAAKLGKALDICTAPDAEIKITGRSDGASCKEFGDYIMSVCEKL